jgi:hypothetical protein
MNGAAADAAAPRKKPPENERFMPTATITFEDTPDGAKVRVAFLPPLKRGEALTDAQELAMQVTQSLADHPDRESLKVTGKK